MVENGTLLLTLPCPEDHKIFERLHAGSSLGQYSLLRAKYENDCRIFYQVHSLRASTIYLISTDLLQKVRDRYPILKEEIKATSKWLACGSIPYCDFWIDFDRISEFKYEL